MTPLVLPGSGAPVAAAPTVAAILRAAGEHLAAVGIATARQDAEALLAHALGTTRLGLYTRGPDGGARGRPGRASWRSSRGARATSRSSTSSGRPSSVGSP